MMRRNPTNAAAPPRTTSYITISVQRTISAIDSVVCRRCCRALRFIVCDTSVPHGSSGFFVVRRGFFFYHHPPRSSLTTVDHLSLRMP